MVAVYGKVPEYTGIGRPPTLKQPQAGWQYLQVIKQRENGQVIGTRFKVVFGEEKVVLQTLGKSTSFVERTHLTMRQFNGRLAQKTLAFSKDLAVYQASAAWEDLYYNLGRSLKTLRLKVLDDPRRRWQPRTPAMAASLTNHIRTVKEILTAVALPNT